MDRKIDYFESNVDFKFSNVNLDGHFCSKIQKARLDPALQT